MLVMIVFVYGLVVGIVKLDDFGLYLLCKGVVLVVFGCGLLVVVLWLMKFFLVVGIVVMFLVGGGILVYNVLVLYYLVLLFGGEG